MEKIGGEILKKLNGSPLAAKMVGSLSHSRIDNREWESILQNKFWDLPSDEDGISPTLKLCSLPSHLKQCFAVCSVFHKGYVFT
ncbi:hypothetical protein QJS10_CPB11g01585 [Acorus calamus]|uniref:NB-ARC domain-containing protein n=1 Tax=Acorus calamus TaxID=4465 RepID=A0AAV9DUB2_ACOCL|nr:hypothetical protein QJS10_CPB11g01585 [Acorus calamus]